MYRKLIYLISFVLVFGLVQASVAEGADPNLVAHYEFEGNFNDSSANANHGTSYGGVSIISDPCRGQVASFDGVDGSYVALPIGSVITTLDKSTIATWVNWSMGDDPNWQRIFDFGTSQANYIYLCPRTAATNQAMRVAITNYQSIWYEFDATTGALPTGWHHVAVTLEPNIVPNNMKLYLDGEVVGSGNSGYVLSNLGNTSRNWLGRSEYPADPYFNGSLDDFRIYDYVLSQAEIKKAANPERASMPIPADGSIINQPAVTLQWDAGLYAADVNGHHVYFGDNWDDVNEGTGGTDKGLTSSTTYPLTGLEPGLTYYWRIDEVNDPYLWAGEVWSFMVQPLTAYNPSPRDVAKYVDVNDDLTWSPGAKAKFHDVYLGTDVTKVTDANRTIQLGVLVSENQGPNTYEPGTLQFDTTYYWRIDEVNDPNIWKGNVWSFETNPKITPTDPNLVGWWKFDDGESSTMAFDSAGYYYNHGTLYGPNWVAGYDGNALDFDGINDYVSLPIGEVVNSLTSCTLTTWVNWSGIGGDWQRIFNFGTSTDNYTYISPNSDTDAMWVAIIAASTGQTDLAATTGTLPTGWHHVAVVSDPCNLQLYLDGQDVGSILPNSVLSDLGVTTDNWFGRAQWPNDPYFDGSLDDFRIYNKVLTQDEIKLVMRVNPLLAWNPRPARGSTPDLKRATPLSWSPGVYADKHDVYFGTDETKVTDANRDNQLGVLVSQNQDANTYDPCGLLELSQTYYWRIDEVNDPNIWRGNVWSFTVAEYLVVEDFDSYVGDGALRAVWKDYFTQDPYTSAEVYVETGVEDANLVQDGNSMRYWYRNNEQPYFSEADADTADLPGPPSGSDWTASGVKALVLYFYGQAGNDANEQMYVKLHDADSNAVVTYGDYDEDPNDLRVEEWQEWNIDLEDFNSADVDLTNVTRITIGFGDGSAGGEGTVYFEDIRLYPRRCVPSRGRPAGDFDDDCDVDYDDLDIIVSNWLISDYNVIPVEVSSSDPNLAARYEFEGDFNDSSGNGNHGDPCGGVSIISSGDPCRGDVASFDGYDDYVELPIGDDINSMTNSTFMTWVDFSNDGGAWQRIFDFGTNLDVYMFLSPRIGTDGVMRFAITTAAQGGEEQVDAPDTLASGWHHVAVTIDADNNTISLYLDGLLVDANTAATLTPSDLGVTTNNWLGRSQFAADANYMGSLDDFRIYDRALSDGEVAWIYGLRDEFTQPLYLLLTPANPNINAYDDGTIDFKDYAAMAKMWLEEQLWPEP